MITDQLNQNWKPTNKQKKLIKNSRKSKIKHAYTKTTWLDGEDNLVMMKDQLK
jgi:hypothetical protein